MAKLKTGRHTSALKAQRQSVKRNSANTGLKKVVRLAAKEVAKTKTAESVAKASSAKPRPLKALRKLLPL